MTRRLVSGCVIRPPQPAERVVVERALGAAVDTDLLEETDPAATDIIAVVARRIVGSAQLVHVRESPREGHWIYGVYVFPAWRRLGVGRRLVDRLMTAAAGRGAAEVLLCVDGDNVAALGLYGSAGFRPYRPGGELADWLAATSEAAGREQLLMRRGLRV